MEHKELMDSESPIIFQISFNKLLEHYEEMAQNGDVFLADRAQRILDAQAPFPILRDGFTDQSLLFEHKDVIRVLLQDSFPEALTYNEIKTAALPYENLVFNSSKRFQKIIENAGPGFELTILNLQEDIHYIVACTIILNLYYGVALNFKRSFFYSIPDADGVALYYRIMYNADFIEVIPTDRSRRLSQNDIEELLENFDNLDLWKDKIPPSSFICKGFVISNMFDVTRDYAISEIKSNLISDKITKDQALTENLNDIFRSLFNMPHIRFGLSIYNLENDQFERNTHSKMPSFILEENLVEPCSHSLCKDSYIKLLKDNDYLVISNVDKYYGLNPDNGLYERLRKQGVKSAIFAPISADGKLFGILELVSGTANELHGINAKILEDIMPYIVSAVLRTKAAEENLIDAIIQHECTTVHTSVNWKFREEAKRFMMDEMNGMQPSFGEIVFKDIHPLYGQTDIKDSSVARNKAIQYDLLIQLSEIKNMLKKVWEKHKFPIYEELIFRANHHIEDIKESLHTNSEQTIFDFIKQDIVPVLAHIKKTDAELDGLISDYKAKINPETGSYYDHRRNYEESVMLINKKLAAVLDRKQDGAQSMYPHYFERYKTDGVEHNIYIGGSIAQGREFDLIYRNNLRLWQLQVICEMENAHYGLKPKLPLPLDVTSLILVYNTSLAIRFRMDEKRFDVDGTYNARYEVIKKRIDKSYIKDTNERLTQTGMLAIVYTQKKDELEYLRYIKFLRSKGYFGNNIEIVELEGLQGVAGLKAIKVEILYDKDRQTEKTYSYEDLMEELKG
jgi:hypothetical protein